MRYTLLARPTLEVPYTPSGMFSSVGRRQGMLATHRLSSPMAAISWATTWWISVSSFRQAAASRCTPVTSSISDSL